MFDDVFKYSQLLEKSLDARCQFFLFVVRPESAFKEYECDFFTQIKPYIKEEISSNEWPGTKLLNRNARVIICNFNESSLKILKSFSSSFRSWNSPEMPEDFCILYDAATVFIASSSTEKFVWLNNEKSVLPDVFFLNEHDCDLGPIKWNKNKSFN